MSDHEHRYVLTALHRMDDCVTNGVNGLNGQFVGGSDSVFLSVSRYRLLGNGPFVQFWNSAIDHPKSTPQVDLVDTVVPRRPETSLGRRDAQCAVND